MDRKWEDFRYGGVFIASINAGIALPTRQTIRLTEAHAVDVQLWRRAVAGGAAKFVLAAIQWASK